ncbi:MAG: hypothetical protein IPM02_06525 [Betaproteobacteria bacterium]|nr:hypothetical protein [Betaproteobacteria bacterium]
MLRRIATSSPRTQPRRTPSTTAARDRAGRGRDCRSRRAATPLYAGSWSPTPGPNSHFYAAVAEECNFLKQLAATTPASQPRWNFEGIAFASSLPVGGMCLPGTLPVYRAYNNGYLTGKDSNHRITTNADAIQQVVAQGWRYEGVAMCAPQ